MPFPIETTVEFEEVYPWADLDIMATFRVHVEQWPGRPWTFNKIDVKTQRGGWERVSSYSIDLYRVFDRYACGDGEQAIIDAVEVAQAEAAEASRSDAGDVRREMEAV